MPPEKQSKLAVAEVCDAESGEVLSVTFSCYATDGTAWFGQAFGVRKYDLHDDDYQRLLRPLSDEQVYPIAPPGITIYSPRDTSDFHIKRTNLTSFDDAEIAKILPSILLDEVITLEALKQHRHPNIVSYFGCILKGKRIAGLVLAKYPMTLQQCVDQGLCNFDELENARFLHGLHAGVGHLHALGLAHNDLNPTNIAINEIGNAVIIDFGSCKNFGEDLISAGTPGWFDEDSPDWAVSAKAHDEFGLQKIEAWLKSKSFDHTSKEVRNK